MKYILFFLFLTQIAVSSALFTPRVSGRQDVFDESLASSKSTPLRDLPQQIGQNGRYAQCFWITDLSIDPVTQVQAPYIASCAYTQSPAIMTQEGCTTVDPSKKTGDYFCHGWTFQQAHCFQAGVGTPPTLSRTYNMAENEIIDAKYQQSTFIQNLVQAFMPAWRGEDMVADADHINMDARSRANLYSPVYSLLFERVYGNAPPSLVRQMAMKSQPVTTLLTNPQYWAKAWSKLHSCACDGNVGFNVAAKNMGFPVTNVMEVPHYQGGYVNPSGTATSIGKWHRPAYNAALLKKNFASKSAQIKMNGGVCTDYYTLARGIKRQLQYYYPPPPSGPSCSDYTNGAVGGDKVRGRLPNGYWDLGCAFGTLCQISLDWDVEYIRVLYSRVVNTQCMAMAATSEMTFDYPGLKSAYMAPIDTNFVSNYKSYFPTYNLNTLPSGYATECGILWCATFANYIHYPYNLKSSQSLFDPATNIRLYDCSVLENLDKQVLVPHFNKPGFFHYTPDDSLGRFYHFDNQQYTKFQGIVRYGPQGDSFVFFPEGTYYYWAKCPLDQLLSDFGISWGETAITSYYDFLDQCLLSQEMVGTEFVVTSVTYYGLSNNGSLDGSQILNFFADYYNIPDWRIWTNPKDGNYDILTRPPSRTTIALLDMTDFGEVQNLKYYMTQVGAVINLRTDLTQEVITATITTNVLPVYRQYEQLAYQGGRLYNYPSNVIETRHHLYGYCLPVPTNVRPITGLGNNPDPCIDCNYAYFSAPTPGTGMGTGQNCPRVVPLSPNGGECNWPHGMCTPYGRCACAPGWAGRACQSPIPPTLKWWNMTCAQAAAYNLDIGSGATWGCRDVRYLINGNNATLLSIPTVKWNGDPSGPDVHSRPFDPALNPESGNFQSTTITKLIPPYYYDWPNGTIVNLAIADCFDGFYGNPNLEHKFNAIYASLFGPYIPINLTVTPPVFGNVNASNLTWSNDGGYWDTYVTFHQCQFFYDTYPSSHIFRYYHDVTQKFVDVTSGYTTPKGWPLYVYNATNNISQLGCQNYINLRQKGYFLSDLDVALYQNTPGGSTSNRIANINWTYSGVGCVPCPNCDNANSYCINDAFQFRSLGRCSCLYPEIGGPYCNLTLCPTSSDPINDIIPNRPCFADYNRGTCTVPTPEILLNIQNGDFALFNEINKRVSQGFFLGYCTCNQGYTGISCEIPLCPTDSLYNVCGNRLLSTGVWETHGVCKGGNSTKLGKCVCNSDWSGTACSIPKCPSANGYECNNMNKSSDGKTNVCDRTTRLCKCNEALTPQLGLLYPDGTDGSYYLNGYYGPACEYSYQSACYDPTLNVSSLELGWCGGPQHFKQCKSNNGTDAPTCICQPRYATNINNFASQHCEVSQCQNDCYATYNGTNVLLTRNPNTTYAFGDCQQRYIYSDGVMQWASDLNVRLDFSTSWQCRCFPLLMSNGNWTYQVSLGGALACTQNADNCVHNVTGYICSNHGTCKLQGNGQYGCTCDAGYTTQFSNQPCNVPPTCNAGCYSTSWTRGQTCLADGTCVCHRNYLNPPACTTEICNSTGGNDFGNPDYCLCPNGVEYIGSNVSSTFYGCRKLCPFSNGLECGGKATLSGRAASRCSQLVASNSNINVTCTCNNIDYITGKYYVDSTSTPGSCEPYCVNCKELIQGLGPPCSRGGHWVGDPRCSTPICSGNGMIQPDGSCKCTPSWAFSGVDCQTDLCRQSGGYYKPGLNTCYCNGTYILGSDGYTCTQGCVNGAPSPDGTTCVCPGAWKGILCQTSACSNGGYANANATACTCPYYQWTGSLCQNSQCIFGTPKQSGAGCDCYNSSIFTGPLCEINLCTQNGAGVLSADYSTCTCNAGFNHSSVTTCTLDFNKICIGTENITTSTGTTVSPCSQTVCTTSTAFLCDINVCYPGFPVPCSGITCNYPDRNYNCQCPINSFRYKDGCATTSCDTRHGTPIFNETSHTVTCLCDPGWNNTDCSQQICSIPIMISHNGECFCPSKLGGPYCSENLCGNLSIGTSVDGESCLCAIGAMVDVLGDGNCIIDEEYCNPNFTTNYTLIKNTFRPICKCIEPATGTTCYTFSAPAPFDSTRTEPVEVIPVSTVPYYIALTIGILSAVLLVIGLTYGGFRLYHYLKYQRPITRAPVPTLTFRNDAVQPELASLPGALSTPSSIPLFSTKLPPALSDYRGL